VKPVHPGLRNDGEMSGQMPYVDSMVVSATMGSREAVERSEGRAAGR
jgi:hypothetical protein